MMVTGNKLDYGQRDSAVYVGVHSEVKNDIVANHGCNGKSKRKSELQNKRRTASFGNRSFAFELGVTEIIPRSRWRNAP
jgi:hypothetical protein